MSEEGKSSTVRDLPAKKCPKCKASALQEDSFCPNCGNALQEPIIQACEKCGLLPKKQDRFCRSCGAPLLHNKK